MPVVGLCLAAIPVLVVLAVTAVVKTLFLPFTALRSLHHRSRAVWRA